MENKSLKLSQKFTTYLEKHRIFELLQELSTMLLIKKPDDHLLFMKQSIYHAARRLDTPRVIILAPPDFDKLELANKLKCELGIPLIRLADISCDTRSVKSTELIECLRMVLMNYMKNNCDGWIFLDFPRSEDEARKLQRIGIIPTHVIEFVVSNPAKEKSSKPDYNTELSGLRRVFSKFLTTIRVAKGDNSDGALEKCLRLVKRRKYSRLGTPFRILLIDFVDPGRCLGQHIARLFNVPHIDFRAILERVCLQDTELAHRVREARKTAEPDDLPSDMKSDIFQRYLLESNAFDKGWVLSGLVSTVDDFKLLDMTDIPPNRVLFIIPAKGEPLCEDIQPPTTIESTDSCDCPTLVKTESIASWNCLTPKKTESTASCDCSTTDRTDSKDSCDCTTTDRTDSKDSCDCTTTDRTDSKDSCDCTTTDRTDSKDSCDCTTSESESRHTCICEESMLEILRYAGETANIIHDHKDLKALKEKIDFCLVQPAPCVPPRIPQPPPEVRPEDVEFDPDGEPSTAILRGIREPEPILTLV